MMKYELLFLVCHHNLQSNSSRLTTTETRAPGSPTIGVVVAVGGVAVVLGPRPPGTKVWAGEYITETGYLPTGPGHSPVPALAPIPGPGHALPSIGEGDRVQGHALVLAPVHHAEGD